MITICESDILQFPLGWQDPLREDIANARALNATPDASEGELPKYYVTTGYLYGGVHMINTQAHICSFKRIVPVSLDGFPSSLQSDGTFDYITGTKMSRDGDLPASRDLKSTRYVKLGMNHRYLGPAQGSAKGWFWYKHGASERRKYLAHSHGSGTSYLATPNKGHLHVE